MENKNIGKETKFFIGFAIITILSGLYLIYSKDYVIGFSGTAVGIMLLMMNLKQIKTHKSE